MSAIFLAQWLCPCGQCYCQKVFKTITWLPLTMLQSNKPHRNSPEPSEPCLRYLHERTPELSGTCLRNLQKQTPELSGTFRKLPPEPAPAHTGTLWNLPELTSRTYTSTHRNSPEPSGTCRNLHQQHPGTLRNLPEPASGTYTGTLRNHQHIPELQHIPDLSGTCLRNLHQHTPDLSGTFRNLPPEPAPATRTGTHRSLSGLKTPLAYAVGELKNYNNKLIIEKIYNI